MPTIIVCTNFSETSRNALSYGCSLVERKAEDKGIALLLLHVYTIPANYCGDGIALITINLALENAEENLHEELDWAHENYPEVAIIGKVTTGRLIDGLRDEIDQMEASLVILGTGGHYGDLSSWDNQLLHILTHLTIPVITIPPGVSYAPLQNIAFACNLKNINESTPFDTLCRLVHFTEAKLHVVYVTDHPITPDSIEAERQQLLIRKLISVKPIFHTLLENEVLSAIGRFVEENNINLLLVIPRKHGIWESLFHKSFTKELARLNKLAIMALH